MNPAIDNRINRREGELSSGKLLKWGTFFVVLLSYFQFDVFLSTTNPNSLLEFFSLRRMIAGLAVLTLINLFLEWKIRRGIKIKNIGLGYIPFIMVYTLGLLIIGGINDDSLTITLGITNFYLPLFFITAVNIRSYVDIERCMDILLIAGSLFAVATIFGFLTSDMIPSNFLRLYGSSYVQRRVSLITGGFTVERSDMLWIHYNTVAYLYGILAIFALYKLFTKRKYFACYLPMLMICVYRIMICDSRGAVFALLLSLSVFLYLYFYRSSHSLLKTLFLSSFMLLTAAVLVNLFIHEYVASLIEGVSYVLAAVGLGGGSSLYGEGEIARLVGMELAWEEFKRSPVFGVGLHPVGLVYRVGSTFLVGGNHLYYLNLLAQFGIVGCFLFLSPLFKITVRIFRDYSSLKSNYLLSILSAVLFCTLVFICVMLLFAPWRADTWAIFGICAAAARMNYEKQRTISK